MGYIKLLATQDTFIQDRPENAITAKKGTSANFGASETLEIASRKDPVGFDEKFVKRILIQFTLSSLTAATNDGRIKSFSDPAVSATLKMFNVNHSSKEAEFFDINVFPVLSKWLEGTGTESETSPLSGFANWNFRRAGLPWADPGLGLSGALTSNDVDVSASAQSENLGSGKNLSLDVKSIISNWIDGTSANNGFLLTLDQTSESITASDFGVKKFYGRETNTVYEPYIEIIYDDDVKDDRGGLPKGTTGNLALYNIINGGYQDITQTGFGTNTGDFLGTVTLFGATAENTLYVALTGNQAGSALTASRIKKGVYRTNFGLGFPEYKEKGTTYGTAEYGENYFNDTTINEFQFFKDVWTVTSNHPLTALSTSSVTSTWKSTDIFSTASLFDVNSLIVSIKNFKDQYHHENRAIFRLFIEQDGLNPAPLTASLNALTPGVIVKNSKFKVVEYPTNREVIPYLDIDYDKDGNFFEVDMKNLEAGRKYKIILKLNSFGETKVLDKNLFVFEVI